MNVNVEVLIRVSVITVGLVRIIMAKPGGQERETPTKGRRKRSVKGRIVPALHTEALPFFADGF